MKPVTTPAYVLVAFCIGLFLFGATKNSVAANGADAPIPVPTPVHSPTPPIDIEPFPTPVHSPTPPPTILPVVGNGKDFFQNTDMTASGNYTPSGLPTNTDDVRITRSSSTGLTITKSSLTMESLNVDNGGSYTIRNAILGGANSTLTLGNGIGFTNLFSGVDNDLIYLTGSSTLTIQGPNTDGGTGVLNVVLASSGNFNVGTGSTLNISSVISGSGINLTKSGGGIATLSGASTYSGTTTISAGTLKIDSAGSTTARLAATTSITINSGGTLLMANSSGTTSNDRINDSATMTLAGGTFNTAGLSEHGATNNTAGIGALTLTASSILDMGTGSSIMAFADSHLASWTGTLSIYNWSGTPVVGSGTDQLYFGNSSGGLTTSQLGEINIYSDSGATLLGAAMILADGEIVPVPEPGTWAAGTLTALAIIGALHRRYSRRRSLVSSSVVL